MPRFFKRPHTPTRVLLSLLTLLEVSPIKADSPAFKKEARRAIRESKMGDSFLISDATERKPSDLLPLFDLPPKAETKAALPTPTSTKPETGATSPTDLATPPVPASAAPITPELRQAPLPASAPQTPAVPQPQPTPAAATPSLLPSLPTANPQLQQVPLQTLQQPGPAPQTILETRQQPSGPQKFLINLNNVSIAEYIRFISRISGKNFLFNQDELNFNVTIVSEELTSLDEIMTVLMNELRIHGMSMIEQGNNIIIHNNPAVNSLSTILPKAGSEEIPPNVQIVTRVFRLSSIDPTKVREIITPLLSQASVIEAIPETGYLIVTDLTSNIERIADLLVLLDSPTAGIVVGQYKAQSLYVDSLAALAEKIVAPLAQEGKRINFVPFRETNTLFVVSTPPLVAKAMSILRDIDGGGRGSGGFTYGPGGERYFNGYRMTPDGLLLDANGRPIYRVGQDGTLLTPDGRPLYGRDGRPLLGPDGKPINIFSYGTVGPDGRTLLGPDGKPILGPDGRPLTIFSYGGVTPGAFGNLGTLDATLAAAGLPSLSGAGLPATAGAFSNEGLPLGHVLSTDFEIYKLQYRKGDQIQQALQAIASSLMEIENSSAYPVTPGTPTEEIPRFTLLSAQSELIAAISSTQWLEASNMLVFTGTKAALAKLRSLVDELDLPNEQVLIELLLLDTTIADSLTYGVDFGTRFGSQNSAGAQGMNSLGTPLAQTLNGQNFPNGGILNAGNLALATGFNLGVIGQNLIHCGTAYGSIGALVRAVHDLTDSRVVLNQKILVEDNQPAEIFVGLNVPFKTQSVANDFGSILTNNFEYRDIGATLKVTPFINKNGLITLQIEQELSTLIGSDVVLLSNNGFENALGSGPTTRKSNTKTTIFVPNGFFVILSGNIQDETDLLRSNLPCLGGIPIVGALFSNKTNNDSKRALMMFIRPCLVNTKEEIHNQTKRQQDIFREKSAHRDMWEWEIDQALDFLNVNEIKSP